MLSEALAGAVAKYHTDIKWQLQHSEKYNKEAKDKGIKQKYLLVCHPQPKLIFDAVRVIPANRINEQLYVQFIDFLNWYSWTFKFHKVMRQHIWG